MLQQSMKIEISKGILACIFCMCLFTCNHSNKSELVLSLEKIFYSDRFTNIPDKVFNVVDFGAVADGKTLTTQAIQRAIDEASNAGGGKVVFEKGTYLSGSIFVKSNVEFHIAEGVTIKAIQDDSPYPERMTRIGGIEMEWPSALINV